MAERAVQRRKSQLFLTTISPVTNTYDELVQEKLETGKFPTTKTGIIKIIGMLVLLFSLAFFLGQPKCSSAPSWYPYLFPTAIGSTVLVQFVLFMIFSMGVTVNRPGTWIYLDVILNLIMALGTIISSVLTFKECSSDRGSLKNIPGPVGIAGGIVIIISCGAIFLMYRFIDDEVELNNTSQPQTPKSRPRSGSIFA